jgi:hypothetical protein
MPFDPVHRAGSPPRRAGNFGETFGFLLGRQKPRRSGDATLVERHWQPARCMFT